MKRTGYAMSTKPAIKSPIRSNAPSASARCCCWRKLLASSTFAIAATLAALEQRLEAMLATAIDDGEEAVAEDFESFGEMVEEWSEAEEPEEADDALDPDAIKAELDEVKAYGALTASIVVNAKGEALLQALRHGFAKLAELGAARKFECHR